MKIVISPDSFKGSLTALEATYEINKAIKEISQDIETVLLPVADGGEGTLEALITATQGSTIEVEVYDPIGRLIKAEYGVLGDGETCVIEMAKASGIMLLQKEENNPLQASTFGTGELVLHALNRGYKKFIIGLGGSATNDGGTGMLRALGMKFLNKYGKEIPLGPQFLRDLHEIDPTDFDGRIKDCHFILASDVDNPFVGLNGATKVFGPQKGVTSNMVKVLDKNLEHLANIIEEVTQITLHKLPGAGAAGGLGGAFLAFFPVYMKPGIEVVMEAINFEEHIKNADFIITGEGKSDSQTLSGKAPIGIAKVANKHNVPVILISGYIEPLSIRNLSSYFSKLVSIVDHSITLEKAMRNPTYHLGVKTSETMNLIL
ncbi:glycerate kinase [Psychrobacillus psychrodurans]|uniref:glycerate kinase n=1 Tax=Psychrobacillus psychrodurans TaxID=126157 RepID=UPI0008F2021D|nr:glycerate kinase [Psychrobacillus psychrodurans]MCZ8542515.1 glycerate kinase [Psychrobacillus psychrodurans]SFN28075.1 glycerate kinase [Psychrobacillus psychrodurans]